MPSLLEADLSYPKIFVTGIYGSGKSTIAHRIATYNGHPYKPFDTAWNYALSVRPGIGTGYVDSHFAKLGNQFVVDAIAFNTLPDIYISFGKFYEENAEQILIVCALCLSLEEWLKRISKKRIKHGANKIIADYIDFHTTFLSMHESRRITYYDTLSGRYVSAGDVQEHAESVIRETEKENHDTQ